MGVTVFSSLFCGVHSVNSKQCGCEMALLYR